MLPSQNILADRISEAGYKEFTDITRIDRKLAGKTLLPFKIASYVETAMCVYAARKGDYEDSLRMRRGKDYLLGVILQDYPLAIALLQSHGVITMPVAPIGNKDDINNLRYSFNTDNFSL